MFKKRSPIISFTVIFLFLSSSCAMPPSKDTVRDVVTQYYQAKKFNVIDIDISDIKPLPVGEQRYMGTKAYLVEIKSITFEAIDDIGSPVQYKKGDKLTFQNGLITIREKQDKKGELIISNISGIAIL